MAEEIMNEVMNEKVVAEEVKEEVKETKPKTKRTKNRKLEELVQAATRGMTEKEKSNLIDYLRDVVESNNLQIEALRKNCEQAYAQARELEAQYKAMEDHYRTKLQYVDELTRAFGKAIVLATRGGLQ